MDMSYSTISVVGGNKRLYSEKRSAFVVNSQENLDNHHIHLVDNDLGYSIFFNVGSPCDPKVHVPIEVTEDEEFEKRQEASEQKQKEEGLWTMYFDGFVAKFGVGVGVYIISPIRHFKSLSYKLTFECTNNVEEHEALLLGLNALKYMGDKRIQVFGDSDLVINQVNYSYQTRHPRMMDYRNELWDMFGNYFIEHTIKVVPRYENTVVDYLAVAAGKFKTQCWSKRIPSGHCE